MKRDPTPPIPKGVPLVTIWNPWPPELRFDEKVLSLDACRDFTQWVSCLAGDKDAVLAILFKPKSSSVVIELSDTFKDFGRLLGSHRWKDEIKRLNPVDKDGESRFYLCAVGNSHELEKSGWKSRTVEGEWVDDFNVSSNALIKPSWPAPQWCAAPTEPFIVGDRRMCRDHPKQYFPDIVEEEKTKTNPSVVIPGALEWANAKGKGIEIKDTRKPLRPNGQPAKTSSTPRPAKAVGVGASSQKGLPPKYPKKQPPPDDQVLENAMRSVLGATAETVLVQEVAAPDMDPSPAFDWATEVEREEEEKRRATQEYETQDNIDAAAQWDAQASWPNWEGDDDSGDSDDESASMARGLTSRPSACIGKGTQDGEGWGIEPSWDDASTPTSPSAPARSPNAFRATGNVWNKQSKPATPNTPAQKTWSRNVKTTANDDRRANCNTEKTESRNSVKSDGAVKAASSAPTEPNSRLHRMTKPSGCVPKSPVENAADGWTSVKSKVGDNKDKPSSAKTVTRGRRSNNNDRGGAQTRGRRK